MIAMGEKKEVFERLCQVVVDGDEEAAKKSAREAVDTGIDPVKAIERGLSAGMKEMGDRFERGETYLPELMLAADAMKAGMTILLSKIPAEKIPRAGTVVIGTVYGDIHDIGKNLVASLLTAAGFEVHDLGKDVKPMTFVERAEDVKADIIALSSLMTVTFPYITDVISILDDMGAREKYKIMVGGGAVTKDLAEKIDADGYGENASEAVRTAKNLIRK